MTRECRICVIGAGPSGLTAAKALIEAGFHPTLYEQSDDVGGLCVFAERPSHSSVSEFTHIISSKSLTRWDDYPMPVDYPDYPSHERMLAYIPVYARHFNLNERITFRTRVAHSEPEDSQGWRVIVEGPGGRHTEHFDHLVVGNGPHWDPLMPDLPGGFSGRLLHAHDCKTARGLEGQRVLVIGGGDI